jgi:hypothetical protein
MLRSAIRHLGRALGRVLVFVVLLVTVVVVLTWLLPTYGHWLFWQVVLGN